MSSRGPSSVSPSPAKPTRKSLPASDVREFRDELDRFLNHTDDQGRKWGDARWGVYAFYDYDGEPIYVGQTNERLRVRVKRHLTNQRTDAVAMRILDVFEVAEVEVWPLWELQDVTKGSPAYELTAARKSLDALEYSAYLEAIAASRFRAILNEKIPPVSEPRPLPESLRWPVITDSVREERGHPDIRIARRAETVSRLAAVARERGEVSEGLRRVLVIQAVRLAFLSAERLAYVEGRHSPNPDAIRVEGLVGSVTHEHDTHEHGTPEYSDEQSDELFGEDWDG